MNPALPSRERGDRVTNLSGHADLKGLLLALSDWSAERRLIEKEGSNGPT